ncbi:MAG: hypothetical protein ABL890_02690 [Candidatus Peribacteraceae bacterium]
MSLTYKTLLGLFLAALTGIGSVLAVAPSVVTDVTASMTQDGGVAVSWSPVSGAVSYNVYFSRQSILGNGGDYDDFQSTTGAESTYIFSAPPIETGTLYVAVLAVTASGEESEGFATEGSVVIGSAPVTNGTQSSEAEGSSSSEAPASSGTTSEPMNYKAVQAVSATGVTITFTKALDMTALPGAGHFVITDSGGTILTVSEVHAISAETVLLKTMPQAAKRQYVIGLVQNVRAADGTTMTVSVPRALFDGFEAGAAVVTSGSSSEGTYARNPALGDPAPTKQTITGPSLVDTTIVKERNGTKTVRVTWTPVPEATSYVLYTAQGDGEFSVTGTASADQTSAQLKKVTAKSLRVKVTAKNAEGQESIGTESMVPLSGGTSAPLTKSGIPLLGAVLVAGALAGRRLVSWRKR